MASAITTTLKFPFPLNTAALSRPDFLAPPRTCATLLASRRMEGS